MNIFARLSPFRSAIFLAVALVSSGYSQETGTFHGEEAVRHLKEQGQYDSLLDAVNAARTSGSEANVGPAPEAVGQSARLTGDDSRRLDQFGHSIAVSGDTAVVGAPLYDWAMIGNNEGAAYVFVRSGTTWTQQQRLIASDASPVDRFGVSVAISGETVVVGASGDTTGAITAHGSAYVFVRSGTTWTQQQKLVAADAATNDAFGGSVAISGDTLVAGASGDNSSRGSAYVFVRSGSVWAQQQRLFGADGLAEDRFGVSVALDSNTIVVGARYDDVGGNVDQGSAYVFVRSGSVWTQQQQLIGVGGTTSSEFGSAVALSGDTAVVGSVERATGVAGAAFVFVRNGTSWTQQQKLTPSDPAAFAKFGNSVAISGDNVVVGADFEAAAGAGITTGGWAYLFVRTGTVWTQRDKLIPMDAQNFAEFGSSVGISGDSLFVGAARHDVGANEDQGVAYVFRVLSSGWSQEGTAVASDGSANDNLGYSVAISGDFAVVGSYRDDIGGNTDQGSAYIFVRNGGTWTQQQQLLAADGAANDSFGFRVAISRDTAVIGAHLNDVGGNANQGSVYVFVRSGAVWTQQQQLTASDGLANDLFGYGVAISGDRVVVGARADSIGGNVAQGSAYIFTRAGTQWSETAKLIASGGAASDFFGSSVSISGDIVVAGAPNRNSAQGAAYVFIRSGGSWIQQQQLLAADGAASDLFGSNVDVSGETAIVGAHADDVNGVVDQGSAYVFVRNGTVWTQQQRLTASDSAASDNFGFSIALEGDTAVVGAYRNDVGANVDQGSAYVFERTGNTWSQRRQLVSNPAAPSDRFGHSVSISGDKIVVSAPLSDVPAADQGAAFFFVNAPSLAVTSAVSRKTHGAAGTFDILLPLTGTPAVECRSSNGAHTLVFTFTNTLAGGNASVTSGVGSVSGTPAFSGNTMTVNLTGVADVQQITVTLAGVTDSFGQVLPPAAVAVSVNMLVGDINASKTVNASDIGSVKSQSGLPVTATNFRADVAVSGGITASDIGLVKSRSGQAVP
jgi:hypothetical protein